MDIAYLQMAALLAGGIGLFMLGMQMMTEGLKFAAGDAIRQILKTATKTRLAGVLSGAFITSLVQSSSAVTVAAIGFVNAGLLKLGEAVTIIYGSNVGTTMTGWLVALIGFNFNINAFALPMVGFGMLLKISKSSTRYGAFGEAITGFGIFFIGIDFLKDAFAGLGSAVDLSAFATGTLYSDALFVLVGFFLTVLMQSSSAAMAITLTAAAGGAIALTDAASVVIGANIGTTSTAAFAVIGATPNAKRVAAAHVIFNLLTGVVALMLLPLLIMLLSRIQPATDGNLDIPSILALFHTAFNILGLIIMLPFTSLLVRFLLKRFHTVDENEAKPVYLDRHILKTPVLALNALARELERLHLIARRMAQGALSSEGGPSKQLASDRTVLEELQIEVANFSNALQRSQLPSGLDEMLPNALRITGYHRMIAELSFQVAALQSTLRPVENSELAEKIANFKGSVVRLLLNSDTGNAEFSIEGIAEIQNGLKEEYNVLKAALLRAGTKGLLPVKQMAILLELISDTRRIAEQVEKATLYLVTLHGAAEISDGEKTEPPPNEADAK